MTAEAIRLLKLARGSIIIQCPSCRQPIPFSETQHLIEETIRTLDGEADAKRDARLKDAIMRLRSFYAEGANWVSREEVIEWVETYDKDIGASERHEKV